MKCRAASWRFEGDSFNDKFALLPTVEVNFEPILNVLQFDVLWSFFFYFVMCFTCKVGEGWSSYSYHVGRYVMECLMYDVHMFALHLLQDVFLRLTHEICVQCSVYFNTGFLSVLERVWEKRRSVGI